MLKSLGEVSDLVYVDVFDLLCSIAVGTRPSGFQNGGLKQTVCDRSPKLYTPILTRTRATPGLRTPEGPRLCARAVRSDIGTPTQFGDVFVQTS